METGIFTIVGVGVVAAALVVVLRQTKPEYAMLVSLATGIFILYKVLNDLVPVVAQIDTIFSTSGVSAQYGEILFKALGISLITQIACDTCKDAGESAIASKLEMAGRIAVLAVSLPLFTQVLSIVRSLMD